jgi:hypothetical protein
MVPPAVDSGAETGTADAAALADAEAVSSLVSGLGASSVTSSRAAPAAAAVAAAALGNADAVGVPAADDAAAEIDGPFLYPYRDHVDAPDTFDQLAVEAAEDAVTGAADDAAPDREPRRRPSHHARVRRRVDTLGAHPPQPHVKTRPPNLPPPDDGDDEAVV